MSHFSGLLQNTKAQLPDVLLTEILKLVQEDWFSTSRKGVVETPVDEKSLNVCSWMFFRRLHIPPLKRSSHGLNEHHCSLLEVRLNPSCFRMNTQLEYDQNLQSYAEDMLVHTQYSAISEVSVLKVLTPTTVELLSQQQHH